MKYLDNSMANLNIYLTEEIQTYIAEQHHISVEELVLSKQKFKGLSNQELANQIKAKHKAKSKLPHLFKRRDIVYPKDLNLQQSSSELTAQFKASLVSKNGVIADLTGGFGIDTMAFSKQSKQVFHIEKNPELSQLVSFNFKQLGLKNITCHATTDIEFLASYQGKLEVCYIDPSRRNKNQTKVFLLEDCTPNIIKNIDVYFNKSKQVMVKLSPLFDLKKIISDLKSVKLIHVVSVKNEVKEVLVILEENAAAEVVINCVNLESEFKLTSFNFSLEVESKLEIDYQTPQIGQFLIEPMASVLKAGGFKSFASQLDVRKLNVNTHLYISDQRLDDAKGRQFIITRVQAYKPKQLKLDYKGTKANVSCRNFPLGVTEIKKKIGIKDGGEIYLFFTTNMLNEKIVIETTKV